MIDMAGGADDGVGHGMMGDGGGHGVKLKIELTLPNAAAKRGGAPIQTAKTVI
jgi:hypothetical protein